MKKKLLGKYRGRVEDNADPQGLGRVEVSGPAALGAGARAWALPCVPYAEPGVGLWMRPPVGADVWVEFEGGDPRHRSGPASSGTRRRHHRQLATM